MKKAVKIVIYVIIILIVAIQFVPVEKTNPPVTNTVKWDSEKTKAFAKRACFDCHSNETRWPWYSHIAPVSWLLADDVKKGRKHLNFSTGKLKHAEDCADMLIDGDMPLGNYLIMHPEAKLTDAEKQQFAEGLRKTFPPEE